MGATALVTGASAGLGAEFSRQLAAEGWDLVLVARSGDRLSALAQELEAAHGSHCEVLSADLLTEAGVSAVETRLRQSPDRGAGRPIGMLVNNAGFGLAAPFGSGPVQAELDMLSIHTAVPLRLTHAALAGMTARGEGRIINVASMAGLAPGGTYAAAKAWSISFSRWAHARFRRSGIRTTALCPGFVETEFHARMGSSPRRLPRFLWLNAGDVVRDALAANAAGRAVSIPSAAYRAAAVVLAVVPDGLLARMAARWPWERTGA